MTRVVRAAGWTLVALGAVILLYVVYLLFFTNLQTERAQQQLLEDWSVTYGDVGETLPGEPVAAGTASEADDDEAVDPGDAYAVVWFERPGSEEPLVHDGPLYLVEGVSPGDLRRGPGHYPDSAAPGDPGNFAISGHRTTYGAPFYHLDDVRPGDEIHVVDRDRREWVYVVTEQRVVAPTDVWVVDDDPLGTGARMMTITTCHPRFSAAQRLIVFAELQA